MISYKFALALLLVCAVAVLPSCSKKPPPPQPAGHIRITASDANQNAQRTSPTAGGGVAVREGIGETEVGIAFYPGAHVAKSGVAESVGRKTAGATLTTRDRYAEVVDFYLKKYEPQSPRVTRREPPSPRTTTINWQDLQGNYTVMIRQQEAEHRTEISLAAVRK